MGLKGFQAMWKIPTRKSGVVLCSALGAALITAFLLLHLLGCNGNTPTKQSPPQQLPPPPTTTGTNVTSSSFGKLFVVNVDGKVDAQPLYLAKVSIASQGMHNVLYVATEHGSV